MFLNSALSQNFAEHTLLEDLTNHFTESLQVLQSHCMGEGTLHFNTHTRSETEDVGMFNNKINNSQFLVHQFLPILEQNP